MSKKIFMTVGERDSHNKMIKELSESVWVGEDGACAVFAQNKRIALKLLKSLMRRDVGEYEARSLKPEDLCVAWAQVATTEDTEEFGSEYEWFCHWKKPETGHYEKVYPFRG